MSDERAPTSSSRWLRALLEVARQEGVDVDAWMRERGYEPTVLDGARAPFSLEREIYRDMPKRLPEFASRVAKAGSEQLSKFRFALASCATLGDALDALVLLSPAISSGFRIVRTDEDSVVEIATVQVTPGEEILPAHAELSALRLSDIGAIAVRGTHERPIEPIEVWFRHGEASASAGIRAAFGERIRFRKYRDAVVFRAAELRRPSAEANPRLAQILREAITAELASLPSPTLRERLWSALAVELSFGVPTAEAVAKRLGLSKRTMNRQIKNDGTQFTKMLQAIRLLRADAWIRAGVPAAVVSSLVHYSEVPAFWRAFRRFFGRNPGR